MMVNSGYDEAKKANKHRFIVNKIVNHLMVSVTLLAIQQWKIIGKIHKTQAAALTARACGNLLLINIGWLKRSQTHPAETQVVVHPLWVAASVAPN